MAALSVIVRPKCGQHGQATWMQTIGRLLLRVRRCSLLHVRLTVQDDHYTRGLLYLPAVRTGGHDQEYCQDRIDSARAHQTIKCPGVIRLREVTCRCLAGLLRNVLALRRDVVM
jgi:hypothetical protein